MYILEFRPLVFFIIEIILAYFIFKNGLKLYKVFSFFLVLLSLYQLGEFLFFITDYNRDILRLSLAATTLIPPTGLLMYEGLSGRKLGSKFVFIIAIVFSSFYIFHPNAIPAASECSCLVKFGFQNVFTVSPLESRAVDNIRSLWITYYFLALLIPMLLSLYLGIKENKKDLIMLFFAYFACFPTSIFISLFTGLFFEVVASLMCALAIFSGIIVAFISVNYKIKSLFKYN